MTRLILNRPHTHAGRLHALGETLDVDPTTADWLIAQDVADPEPKPALAVLEPDPEPKTKPRSATLQRQEPQP
ncbi:MAG: hypothetical protein FJ189_10115 [Gammaproteobacteria bacterium]|nr:hypothetical protein [Gammaproteobacteria bacterium]